MGDLVLPCERPLCNEPGRHTAKFGDDPLPEGWRRLCCHHADFLMAIAADSCTDAEDAKAGWAKWLRTHKQTCGELVGVTGV